MATFIGFNTQNYDSIKTPNPINQGVDGGGGSFVKPIYIGKKFTTYDEQAVIQDFINAMNIQQGSKPGNPSYGTTLWGFIFEPNDITTESQISDEIRRIGALDPRLTLNTINVIPQANGILVQVEFAISPFNNVQTLEILFDQATNIASAQ